MINSSGRLVLLDHLKWPEDLIIRSTGGLTVAPVPGRADGRAPDQCSRRSDG
jgi:hypothetical protein